MRRFAFTVCFIALLAFATATVAAAATTTIVGYEIFPGVRIGDNVYGTTFVGESFTGSDATGAWAARVNYHENAVPVGRSVTITGGSWYLRTAAGATSYGRVSGGTVVWPPLNAGSPCGSAASFSATLAVVYPSAGTGSIVGCLDDTHFPPTIPTLTGVLTLP
jgi:hypothetical protein